MDLSRRTLRAVIDAYRQGAFPMGDPVTRELGWYRPDPRAVLAIDPDRCPPAAGDGLHVPRSLAKARRRLAPTITTDRAFGEVIRACAAPRRETPNNSQETWIDHRIITLFESLHDAGIAHSVEVWLDDDTGPALAGGIYGLAIGRLFCAESMFTRVDNAGKIALVALVEQLRERGFTLMDTQFTNPHLNRFGVIEIPNMVYLEHLARYSRDDVPWD